MPPLSVVLYISISGYLVSIYLYEGSSVHQKHSHNRGIQLINTNITIYIYICISKKFCCVHPTRISTIAHGTRTTHSGLDVKWPSKPAIGQRWALERLPRATKMVSSRGGTGTLLLKRPDAGVWGAQPPRQTGDNDNRKDAATPRAARQPLDGCA